MPLSPQSTGIVLESPEEVSVLISALGIAEALMTGDPVLGTIVLNLGRAALVQTDPEQTALRSLVAKAVIALETVAPATTEAGRRAAELLIARVQKPIPEHSYCLLCGRTHADVTCPPGDNNSGATT